MKRDKLRIFGLVCGCLSGGLIASALGVYGLYLYQDWHPFTYTLEYVLNTILLLGLFLFLVQIIIENIIIKRINKIPKE